MVVAVALGSNLGDRLATLRSARTALSSVGALLAQSQLYETAPQGGPAQGPYLNAVVLLNTDRSAATILQLLHHIERHHGRVRSKETRWGPRTLDLDILYLEEQILSQEELTIPHPRLHLRSFVLLPLAEVSPKWQHPVLKKTVEMLQSELASVDDNECVCLGEW